MSVTVQAKSAGGFSSESFAAFHGARQEPAWLSEGRRQAWRAFEGLPWPTSNNEDWARTDIRLFKLGRFELPSGDAPALAPQQRHGMLGDGLELAGAITHVNSLTVDGRLDENLRKQGVLFCSLDQAVAEHPDLLRPYFDRRVVDPIQDRFAALSAACWTGGTLLYVPKGVCIEQPLHSISVLGANGVDLGRLLVVLDDGAECTLLTETASSEEGPGFHCGTTELILGRGAKLRLVNVQNWSQGVWHFAHKKATLGREARLQWTLGALGSRLSKVNQRVALAGPDAEAQVNGVMFTRAGQHITYNTRQRHEAPYCRSDLLYKNALQDHSRTVWRGMIKVDRAAQRTDAYQRNDNLMLSPEARADSIPGLEIEADDVRCTHGSTSGRVDQQQVFYAMSRGYTRREAVRMIVAGFFQQVFDRITIDSVREALAEAISQRVQDIV